MPSNLVGTLRRAERDIQRLRLKWALVGGIAVSLRTAPRTTKDVDVVIAVADDTEAEKIGASFLQLGYQTFQHLEHRSTGRLSTLRLRPPPPASREVMVDLLLASSGIEPEIVAAATHIEILPGLQPPVASIGHLIAMKLLAAGPKRKRDYDDAYQLLQHASESDLATAREAIDLIERRGYSGEKNLQVELARLLKA